MQHESMSNGYVSLFQVKITSFYSFLRLNHEVLPIKILSFCCIFLPLANVRIWLTPGLQNFFFVRYRNFLTSDLSNETRMSFFLMRQKNALFAF